MTAFEQLDDRRAMDDVWRDMLSGFLSAASVGFDPVCAALGEWASPHRDPFRHAPQGLQDALGPARRAAVAAKHASLGRALERIDSIRPADDESSRARDPELPLLLAAYEPVWQVAGEWQPAVMLETIAWAPGHEQASALTRFAPVSAEPATDLAVRAVLLRAAAALDSHHDDPRAFSEAWECIDEVDVRQSSIETGLLAAVDLSRAYLEARLLRGPSSRRSHQLGRIRLDRLDLEPPSTREATRADQLSHAAAVMFDAAYALEVRDPDSATDTALRVPNPMSADVRRLARDLGFDLLLDRLGLTEPAAQVRLTAPRRSGEAAMAPRRAGMLAGLSVLPSHGVQHRHAPTLFPPLDTGRGI